MFFKLKFSKFIQNIRTLESFGKFLLIVPSKHNLKLTYQAIVNLYIVVTTKNHQIYLNTLTMKMDKAFLIQKIGIHAEIIQAFLIAVFGGIWRVDNDC